MAIRDPRDVPQPTDTEYLSSIPSMRETIIEGLQTPIEECFTAMDIPWYKEYDSQGDEGIQKHIDFVRRLKQDRVGLFKDDPTLIDMTDLRKAIENTLAHAMKTDHHKRERDLLPKFDNEIEKFIWEEQNEITARNIADCWFCQIDQLEDS